MKNLTPFDLPLFGHGLRTRYLIGVAKHGPIANRALGRLLGINPSRLPTFYRDFSHLGFITRDEDGRVLPDERCWAFAELAVLLHAMAGQRVVVIPPTTPNTTIPKRLPNMFGSRQTTRTLVALATMGKGSIKDLALVASVPARTASDIVHRFARHSLLRTERVGYDCLASLNDRHPLHQPLLALLLRAQDSDPRMARLAKAHRHLLRERSQTTPISSRAGSAVLPIGTPAQAQALLHLAMHPSWTIATLATAMGCSRNTARTVVETLARYGLATVATHGRGNGAKRWIALNDLHPLTPALRSFVKHTAPSGARPIVPLAPPAFRPSRRVASTTLPGSALRLRIILETYRNGDVSVPKCGRHDWKPIRRWAEDLHQAGLIDYGPYRGEMTLRAVEAPALCELLTAIRAFLGRDHR